MSHHARFTSPALVFVALLLTLGPPRAAEAQAQARPVYISIPQAFPDLDARAIVLRERGRDVVLLRSGDVSAETLGMALLVLERRRGEEPAPSTGQMIPITGYAYTVELREEERDHLERIVARLGRRPVTRLGTFGTGRWILYRTR